MDQEQLVAIHKNHHGEIVSFMTSTGRVISYRKALAETADGILSGVYIEEGTEDRGILMSAGERALEHYPPIY